MRKRTKKEAAPSLDQPVHGWVISWAKPKTTLSLPDLRAGLLACSLVATPEDADKLARDFSPRVLFGRAMTELRRTVYKNTLLRNLHESPTHIDFQLTVEEKDSTNTELVYHREAILSLNKENGIITGGYPQLVEQVTNKMAQLIALRGVSDFSALVRTLIRGRTDLIPVGDASGVYFVLESQREFLRNLNAFCEQNGSFLHRLPVPQSVDSEEALSVLFNSFLTRLVADLRTAVQAKKDPSKKVAEGWQQRLAELKAKGQIYAVYLRDGSESIKKQIEELQTEMSEA
jgi:hypothetical protein